MLRTLYTYIFVQVFYKKNTIHVHRHVHTQCHGVQTDRTFGHKDNKRILDITSKYNYFPIYLNLNQQESTFD